MFLLLVLILHTFNVDQFHCTMLEGINIVIVIVCVCWCISRLESHQQQYNINTYNVMKKMFCNIYENSFGNGKKGKELEHQERE